MRIHIALILDALTCTPLFKTQCDLSDLLQMQASLTEAGIASLAGCQICRKISQTLCRQRLSAEGSHEGGYPLHKGTVRSHQNGRQETGWGYTSPMGQRKIHRLGFHSHPHVCGFLPPSVVIGTRRGCGTCCGSEA